MESAKDKYTETARKWLEDFLIKNYSKDYKIKVVAPKSSISKLEDEDIKKFPDYSLMDFSSDVLGILTSKKDKKVQLVLLNRSVSAISVKEIGEMNIYAHIINPKLAFILSQKGLPTEVNSLLLNEDICSSLLNYHDSNIFIIKTDENGRVDNKGTFPRKFKDNF